MSTEINGLRNLAVLLEIGAEREATNRMRKALPQQVDLESRSTDVGPPIVPK